MKTLNNLATIAATPIPLVLDLGDGRSVSLFFKRRTLGLQSLIDAKFPKKEMERIYLEMDLVKFAELLFLFLPAHERKKLDSPELDYLFCYEDVDGNKEVLADVSFKKFLAILPDNIKILSDLYLQICGVSEEDLKTFENLSDEKKKMVTEIFQQIGASSTHNSQG